MEKNIPQRMCIACRQMKNKGDLVRFVNTQNGVVLDNSGKHSGRGAYLCNSSECIKKCIKTKALNRAFKTNCDASVYAQLENLNGQN